MKKFPIALQLYSVRDDMNRDFEGTVNTVAAMGYDGVEFAGLFGKSAQEVKDICNNANVKPVSAHVPFTDMMNDPLGIAKLYAEIGVSQIVIPWLGHEYLPGTDGYEIFKTTVKTVAKACEEYGLVLCYHNHDFEFAKLDGKYLLDIMYSDCGEKTLKSQIDLCWAAVGMGAPDEYLSKFVGRAPTVHFKDYEGEKTDNMYELIGKTDDKHIQKKAFEFRPVGYGKQDVKKLLNVSEQVGAEWVIVEQDNPSMGKSALECAKLSVEYIKSIY